MTAEEQGGPPEEAAPEERPRSADPSPQEDEPVTSRDDAAEPAGEEDPANEIENDPNREPEDRGPRTEDSGEDDPLAEARRQRDEYLDLAKRAQADFENYRKRAAREAAAAGNRAKSGIVRELLPVIDNLERALASAGDDEQHLAEGVKLVHSELVALLERNGVEMFDPVGEKFDPEVHEALSTRPDEKSDAGVVLEVVEKGYRLNGTVLRPARVVVNG